MTQLPSYPDSGDAGSDDTGGVLREHRAASGPPRWVSVVGIIFGVLMIALFVALHLAGVVGPGGH